MTAGFYSHPIDIFAMTGPAALSREQRVILQQSAERVLHVVDARRLVPSARRRVFPPGATRGQPPINGPLCIWARSRNPTPRRTAMATRARKPSSS